MATTSATSAASPSLPPGILKYEDEIAKPKATSTGASQQDFLKLFTTQLQNQNPLDPTKNEAFVTSMSGDRMLSGATMIGKKVAVDGAPVVMSGGQPVQGIIDLPAGAEGMRLEILDSQGNLVREQIAGPQTPGEVTLTWDGLDSSGAAVADGNYAFRATITSAGKTTNPMVKTLATVRSISQADAKSPLMLQVDGGLSVALTDVKRVGN